MDNSETKEVLLDKLIGMQDLEAAKRLEEMDTDLIAECTGYVIELTGEELPAAGVLAQMRQKLLRSLFGRRGDPRRRRRLARSLLIAAIVLLLLVAMSVSMMPLGTNDESILHRWGLFLSQTDAGAPKNFGDSLTIVKNGELQTYKSIRQFVRKTKADILIPTVFPEGISVKDVSTRYDSLEACYRFTISTNDPGHVGITVYFDKEITDLSENRTDQAEKIGEYLCYIATEPEWCQCDFNYKGDGYTVTASSYEDLVLIVQNLKGSMEK